MMECIVTITVSCSSHTLSKPNCEIYYFNELAIDFHLERNQEYQLFLRMQYFSRLKSSSGEKIICLIWQKYHLFKIVNFEN